MGKVPGPGETGEGPRSPFDAAQLTEASLQGVRELLGAHLNLAPDGSVLDRLQLGAYEGGLRTSPLLGQVLHETVGAAAFVCGFDSVPDRLMRIRSASLLVYQAGPAGPPQVPPELGIYIVPRTPGALPLIGAGADQPLAQDRFSAVTLDHVTNEAQAWFHGDGIVLSPGEALIGVGDGTAVGDVAVMTVGFEAVARDCRPPR